VRIEAKIPVPETRVLSGKTHDDRMKRRPVNWHAGDK